MSEQHHHLSSINEEPFRIALKVVSLIADGNLKTKQERSEVERTEVKTVARQLIVNER